MIMPMTTTMPATAANIQTMILLPSIEVDVAIGVIVGLDVADGFTVAEAVDVYVGVTVSVAFGVAALALPSASQSVRKCLYLPRCWNCRR